MSKLVVLKFADGSFEQGFSVTLQIGEENARQSIEAVGRLPPVPELPGYYDRWQTLYHQLGETVRLSVTKVEPIDFSRRREACLTAAHLLQDRLNTWLLAEEFRPIREKWLEQLSLEDEIRIIIQTENSQLRRLPWNLLDFMERYSRAEVALSALAWEQITQPKPISSQVRILAVLGDSQGIDTNRDRQVLEQLPQAQVEFLPEPSRKELSDRLWQQSWDILFFGGHSSSQGAHETGRIFLNQTDSLTINELKYALRKAVAGGLKFAIFNSCDGLGLARELAELQIPQVIVMREPVPDRVAQEFLKSFLNSFAYGKSFYLAVREARERLEGLEDHFPCASWLPIICQHPAAIPPTWQDLITSEPNPSPYFSPSFPAIQRGLKTTLLSSLAIASIVMGMRWVGWLQSAELQAFDHFMGQRQLLRDEGPDQRLLIVTIDDDDIARQQRERGLRPGTSLSDQSLDKLLTVLMTYRPAAIGLDLYRDFPPDPAHKDLLPKLDNIPNLIGVCKVSADRLDLGIRPPIGIPATQIGFSDFVEDPEDNVLRRHLMFMTPPVASRCKTAHALSMELAYRYLSTWGIQPSFTDAGRLQLGQHLLPSLSSRFGGYQNLMGQGQILLNYRDTKEIAETITLSNLISGELDPAILRIAIQNRIVLIGVTAHSSGDLWATPYGTGRDQQMPGVLVQAHMVSQILSAVLDQRPLLWSWPFWADAVWVGGWTLVGGTLVWWMSGYRTPGKRLWPQVVLTIATVCGALYGICLLFLLQGGWVPFIPAIVGIFTTSSLTFYRQNKYRP